MRQFEESHPQFFHGYHHARAVVDLPVIPREAFGRTRMAPGWFYLASEATRTFGHR